MIGTTYIDLGKWYRDRLAAGNNPALGSRILARRIASGQGHPRDDARALTLGSRLPSDAALSGLVQPDARIGAERTEQAGSVVQGEAVRPDRHSAGAGLGEDVPASCLPDMHPYGVAVRQALGWLQ